VTLAAVIAVVLIVSAVLGGAGVWFAGLLRRELSARALEVDQRLGGIGETLGRRIADLDQKVDLRLSGMDNRLLVSAQATGETTARIAEKLGEIGGTATQMLARANDLARLEQALRPPKARGGFGELLLENLLRDRLPPAAYEIQHTFSSGDRVDAVVRAGRLLSVDSKFPLENFERLVEAPTDDERQLHQRAFTRDVRAHVDAIATKYIRPEDGTYDFAFMYVPVEAVYYELACGPSAGLQTYAHEKRVFFVSPTTFTAYLQVIVLGLRGMQIEEHANEVLTYVAELGKDFGRFKEDFELVGTHLGRAQTKFADADKRLDKFAGKLERASEDREPELDTTEPLRRVAAA
jgi:DNA recombination protein RmuC